MPYKEKPVKKVYYSLSEVCEIINRETGATTSKTLVFPSTIRFWSNKFPSVLGPSRTDGHGTRKYNAAQINKLIMFAMLMHSGNYTLKGAVQQLKSLGNLHFKFKIN